MGSDQRVKSRRQKHILGLSEIISDRYKRDVREATKYIETAIIIDKAMVHICYHYHRNYRSIFYLAFLKQISASPKLYQTERIMKDKICTKDQIKSNKMIQSHKKYIMCNKL